MAPEFANSVTIGPEFFAKSVNDYRDKFWAFCREILQNSLDCGSTWINISIHEYPDDGDTVVVVSNDGEPMTKEVLLGKLLSLGSSGKDFVDGQVGGFGKAKEILYFAHESYTILTGPFRLEGSGAGYNLVETAHFTLGTTSLVRWKGLVGDQLRKEFRRFIRLCGRRDCRYTLDNEDLVPSIPRFRKYKPLTHEGDEWAQVSVSDFEPHLLVVRIGGIPMFTEHCDLAKTLVLELQGTSGERLTANRDSLKWPFSTDFMELMKQLAVDRRSALTLEEPEYTHYGGPRLKIGARAEAPPDPTPGQAERAEEVRVAARVDRPAPQAGIVVDVQGRREAATSLLPHEFIVKNCVRRRIPREFDPLDVEFSDHAHWLVRAWTGCLIELHRLYELEAEFSIGFVFSEDAVAEYEKSSRYGQVYFLNPCLVTRQKIIRRWKKDARGQIAATAAHEFVHGGFRESYHGEDFAERLTSVAGTMFRHWRRFARHLS